MGWVRVELLPANRLRLSSTDPALLRQIDELNAEADLRDPLSENYNPRRADLSAQRFDPKALPPKAKT